MARMVTREHQASVFKATCLELMDELASQQPEIVVTKHGRPVVKVGPVNANAPSPVGFPRAARAPGSPASEAVDNCAEKKGRSCICKCSQAD